eukprot:19183-Heterococcus_DN1.PRE.1
MRPPMVHTCDLILVDRQPLERVHCNQDWPCASVDEVHAEPLLNVGHNSGLIQWVQIVHILHSFCLLLRCAGQQPQRLILRLAPPVQCVQCSTSYAGIEAVNGALPADTWSKKSFRASLPSEEPQRSKAAWRLLPLSNMASFALGAVQAVTSEADFDAAVKGASRAAVFFWAAWHEPSKPQGQMDAVWTQLAALHAHEGIRFLKVEAEAVPSVSEKYELSVVPTFVLLEGGQKVAVIEGADPPVLAKQVQAFAASKPAAPASDADAAATSDLTGRLSKLINSAPVMLFMKGTPREPRCGFSKTTVKTLEDAGVQFGSFDILQVSFSQPSLYQQTQINSNTIYAATPDNADDEVRQGLKAYSNWPTYPQVYVRGELIGGIDILKEMAADGDLAAALGVTTTATATPARSDGGSSSTAAATATTAAVSKQSIEERCKQLVNSKPVMLFMKGNPAEPRCGFSRTIVALLQEQSFEFSTFDILQDEDVRQGLKEYSNWPTYPQLYIKGELVGGIDIVKEMAESGDLAAMKP